MALACEIKIKFREEEEEEDVLLFTKCHFFQTNKQTISGNDFSGVPL